jgi:hypothetical protein
MAAHIWEDGDPSERASQRGDRQDPPDAQERRVLGSHLQQPGSQYRPGAVRSRCGERKASRDRESQSENSFHSGVRTERRVNRHVGRAPVSVLSDDTYGKIIAGLVAVGRNGLTPPF